MADYNPNAPTILGVEWSPIRQADYDPDDAVERGYLTRLDAASTPVSGSFAVAAIPAQTLQNTVDFVSIYKASNALNSGPARQVIIPVESISITGSKISSTTGDYTALTNPNDINYVGWLSNASVGTDAIGINFDVGGTSTTELAGKRILGVRLIYTASGEPADLGNLQTLIVRRANTSIGQNYQTGLEGQTDLTLNTDYKYVDFGEYNPMWKDGVDAFTGMEIFPWRQQELLLLDSTAALSSRLMVMITGNTSAVFNQPRLGYVALEITYCEETRVLYGGRRSMAQGFPQQAPSRGFNLVQLLDTNFARNTTSLPPDDYIVTLIHKAATNYVAAKHLPTYAAIRPLEQIDTVPGVALRQPAAVGETLTRVNADSLPAVALMTSSSVIVESHPYAGQIAAPIYGAFYAQQAINGRVSMPPGNSSYKQVRFYARHFDGAGVPLTVRDQVTGNTAIVTVEDFDELPEIVDGWREVTIPFAGVSVSGTGLATISFSAPGALPNGQWQILGMQTTFSSNNEERASYDMGTNAGTIVIAQWKRPNAASSFDDPRADLAVSISLDPPLVSGFAITQGSLPVTGVAVECGVPSACIPTGVGYNLVSWTPLGVCDDFEDRTLFSTWGNASKTKQPYTLAGGLASQYDVELGAGTQTHTAVNDLLHASVPIDSTDQELRMRVKIPATPTGASVTTWLAGRFADTSNYYAARLDWSTTNTMTLAIVKRVAGTLSAPISVGVGNYGPGEYWNVALRVVGSRVLAKAWSDRDLEPSTWAIAVTDTSLTSGTRGAIISRLESGNTSTLPYIISVDEFQAFPAAIANGRLQVDRMDEEDLTWHTIIDTANLCITGAYDLEARVGVQNWYRARLANAGEFWGPWVSGAGKIPSPGVYGAGSGNSVLIFTSNRAPLATLAYPMSWDGRPVESFVFPEAETQVFQRMYGRDFQVAFRPLERGGEQFDRTLLVQAAAIPLESLADFNNLRDLAWDELPYVCVRDELGNRWFANVLVPAGNVSRNRRLYLAQVRITEVADVPAPIVA